MSFREIGEEFGYTASGARRINRWAESVVELKAQLHTVCVCGESFKPARAGTVYCSNACRQDAYRKRRLWH